MIDTHEVIVQAAAKGTIASFGEPPDELPDYDDEYWTDRTVDGEWLAEFLTATASVIHHRGVCLLGLRIEGGLDLQGAAIGILDLRWCQLGPCDIGLAESRIRALRIVRSRCTEVNLDDAEVAGSVLVQECHLRRLSIGSTRIRGNLDCHQSRISAPGDDAVFADRADVSGTVVLGEGFHASGEVRLLGVAVGGNLQLNGGTFLNPHGRAISLDGARVTGSLFMDEGFVTDGLVSLVGTSTAWFVDRKANWPDRIDVDGFHYDKIHGDALGWHARRDWLRRQADPGPQGYVQLAAVYRASGEVRRARKILMERHNVSLNPPEHWNLPKSRALWLWRWFLRLTIGHGYEPWRILGVAIPLIVAMTFWYSSAADRNLLIPTGDPDGVESIDCDSAYTCVQPLVYAIDTLVPVVDLGQRGRWTPDQSTSSGRRLAAATWITSLLGWVLATLVAASFTQVTRRE